jgi:hypothetical protein
MSRIATTAPVPDSIGNGADEYATRIVEPSRRKNQSSSTRTLSPVVRGLSSGHSSTG